MEGSIEELLLKVRFEEAKIREFESIQHHLKHVGSQRRTLSGQETGAGGNGLGITNKTSDHSGAEGTRPGSNAPCVVRKGTIRNSVHISRECQRKLGVEVTCQWLM